ncbi:MAG: ribbon-helix-helix domain-containing protein [Candidatus Geothermarchaeales archaeon]
MRQRKEKLVRYASISLPQAVVERIDELIEEFGYWPSRAAFIREACLEKIEKLLAELETREALNITKKNSRQSRPIRRGAD